MTLSRTSSSQDIKKFQEALLTLGYDVGRTGADGDLGQKSLGAAYDAAEDFSLEGPEGGVVPDKTVAEILRLADEKRSSKIALPPNFLDLTDHAATAWRRSVRPWSTITGGTLHQTGCPMPEISDAEMAWFQAEGTLHPKNTKAMMRWVKHLCAYDANNKPQYQSLKTHYGITYRGVIIAVHPLTAFGWHAQGLSRSTIGYELAGFFAGIEDDPKTIPSGGFPVQSVTEAQIAAMLALVPYDKAVLQAHGSDYKFLHPHRIAAPRGSRRPDPGSKAWQRIALPLIQSLHLSDGGPGFIFGSKGEGRLPIPEAWDAAKKGIPY